MQNTFTDEEFQDIKDHHGEICEIIFKAERYPNFVDIEERTPTEPKYVCMDESKAYGDC